MRVFLPNSPLSDTTGFLIIHSHAHLVAATLHLQTWVLGWIKAYKNQSSILYEISFKCIYMYSSCIRDQSVAFLFEELSRKMKPMSTDREKISPGNILLQLFEIVDQ